MSDASGRVADATGNWVDHSAPDWLKPYLRLTRLDRPIGWWLLLLPCWWSSALAAVADGAWGPSPWHIVLLLIGAIVMRGAGCTWNDLVDRDIDAQGRAHPLAADSVRAGERARRPSCFWSRRRWWACWCWCSSTASPSWSASLRSAVVAIYPFMKRVT